MSDFVLYGWPITALSMAFTGLAYFWFQSRRLDRLEARERAEAARSAGDAGARDT